MFFTHQITLINLASIDSSLFYLDIYMLRHQASSSQRKFYNVCQEYKSRPKPVGRPTNALFGSCKGFCSDKGRHSNCSTGDSQGQCGPWVGELPWEGNPSSRQAQKHLCIPKRNLYAHPASNSQQFVPSGHLQSSSLDGHLQTWHQASSNNSPDPQSDRSFSNTADEPQKSLLVLMTIPGMEGP